MKQNHRLLPIIKFANTKILVTVVESDNSNLNIKQTTD
jgi:hypothetical protein